MRTKARWGRPLNQPRKADDGHRAAEPWRDAWDALMAPEGAAATLLWDFWPPGLRPRTPAVAKPPGLKRVVRHGLTAFTCENPRGRRRGPAGPDRHAQDVRWCRR